MVAWKQYLKSFASFFELSLAPRDKAKIVIHYPIQKEIGFDFNTLAFLEELKSEDVEIKQSVFPNV